MNKYTALVAACALALAMPAFGQAQKAPDAKAADTKAAPPAAAPAPAASTNSQQNKMTACNQQAGDKKGDERKAFMKTCLSNTPVAAKPESKMAMCNKKTAGLAKEERAKAQSECMKGA